MLAHRAMAQGEMVAEIIAGKRRTFCPAAIPAVCFTDPEVVVAGSNPDEMRQAGIDVVTAMFPFVANSRSMTLESTEGFVRVVARRDNHLILGRSEEHTSELQSLMRFSYAVFCLNKKNICQHKTHKTSYIKLSSHYLQHIVPH